jgi:HSP20 family protein
MAELKQAPQPKTNGSQGQKAEVTRAKPPVPQLGSMSPFGNLRRFASEMDRVFEEFGFGWHVPSILTRGHELLRRETGLVAADWSPRVDILERNGQILVRADLPGMSKDDIKIEVRDQMLTIQGERKPEQKKEEREGYFYSECSHGHFYRSIPLPEGVDVSKVVAEFHNGVLEVTVPAPPREEPKARNVEIRERK